MHDKEALQMMARCRDEIKELRRQLDFMRPKADAYDRMAQVLDMMPRRSQGMGEDLVWVIDSEMNKIKQRQTETTGEDGNPRSL